MDEMTRRQAVAAAATAGAIGLTVVASQADAAEQDQEKGAVVARAAVAGSEFIVKLNGITLPAETTTRIASAIQAAVLRELAGVDLRRAGAGAGAAAAAGGGLSYRIPDRTWYGMWIEVIREGQLPVLRAQQQAR